jgi:hypothetical protein
MSVYTVHQGPTRADAASAAERFIFVRDSFSWWAFLLAPLWMLRHRMWLVLLAYLAVSGVIEAALAMFGASRTAIAIVGFLIALLVGLEASTLRRLTLRRRGWRHVAVISGDDLEHAERRFFDAWLRGAPSRNNAAKASAAAAASGASVGLPRVAQTPNVIGLFPEPGARR